MVVADMFRAHGTSVAQLSLLWSGLAGLLGAGSSLPCDPSRRDGGGVVVAAV